jgi:GMP synthase-like glutamine amidotransferase
LSPLIILQNSEIEKPGLILEWAKQRKMATRLVRAFENEPFPVIDDVEMLIVLGAPVRVGDDIDWLKNERAWLRRIAARDTLVLGLSFGAHLLADVLGGKVWPAPAAEIGWHEVKFTSFNLAENIAVLFQWRDEEFGLPEGARVLAKCRAGAHHAFQKDYVTALNSHLEIDLELVEAYIEHFWDEKWFAREGRHSPFVQEPEEMRLGLEGHCVASAKFAFDFLDLWSEGIFQSETPLKLLK